MSNCIKFTPQTSSVHFPSDVIDAPKLKAEIDHHKDCKGHFGEDHNINGRFTDMSGTCSIIYWFLNQQNVRFASDGSVIVHFGEANSSHCWRDFQGTIETINQFLIKELTPPHYFTVMDMDMGDNQWETYKGKFAPRIYEKGGERNEQSKEQH